ncbi:hypothetical protein [Kitasatospora sp. NPDC051914]|uniref:hypothetical protein n=1 Tax=Kitasatospora sp. NPDC051914 TaxID=3154945 RepID=UPI003414BEDD
MPATPLSPLPSSVSGSCPSCFGTLRVVDLDGALSGTVGLPVPCDCVSHLYGLGGACPCHVRVWDENDGHTGWVPIPLAEATDDSPFFRPCTAHGARRAGTLAVAA